MFVLSVNKRQIKLAVVLILLAVMCIVLGILTRNSVKTAAYNELNLNASNSDERIAYLSQFGWTVEEEPVEVKEIIIPAEFDDTYENYNSIQKQQGFDLTQYRSKRVKKWTYKVLNYPGYEQEDCIRATLLIFDNKVIGGDICSVMLDGFMHGFVMPETEAIKLTE